ncbi:MAG: LON peptidase substrate-binding domain-containing protein [Alphaproteobacteria bacterium]|nr:LON peptidase substrate-binding domain-containing protein [Alphaproteobacteria bacterium]
MSQSEAAKGEAGFPEIIPIFPLTGVLLLPRGRLPLNIFEPRYLAMTRDALGGERLIGMIQPSEPVPGDLVGRDPAAATRTPAVYPTGCAGRITQFSETDDGRYLITLTGVSRFRIREELPLLSGYRRVVADWGAFEGDRHRDADDDEPGFDRERLVAALRSYFAPRKMSLDWDAIRAAPGEQLVNSLAMLCPFDPGEKQALLEAADLAERARLLTAIVEMAALKPTQPGTDARH